MKPVHGILLGVIFVVAALPMTAGALLWVASLEDRAEETRGPHIHGRTRLTPVPQGPLEQPVGTLLMTVRIDSDDPAAQAVKPGYKVTVVAVTQSEKRKKEIVTPVAFSALVMEVDTSAMEANELTLSVAVPAEQAHLLSYAVDGGTTIRVQLPKCGGWVPHETDSQVFLAAANSTDELLAILYGE